MAIQKPYDLSIRGGVALDGNEENVLTWKSSGDLSVAFSITVRKNSDDSIAWNLPKTNSYAQRYVIPSGSIPNGLEYKIQVTIWNEAGQSATSDFEIFQTSSRPHVTVNVTPVVGNHDFDFIATYLQTESVPIRSYIAYLYDTNKALVQQSGIKTDSDLQHYFSNMKSGQTYYIEFQVTSAKGLTGTSGLIPFDVVYEIPVVNIGLVAENYDNASIKLNWNVIQIIGEMDTKPPIFIDNEIIDLRENRVVFDKGFTVEKNFTLRLWIQQPKPEVDLLLMKGQNGHFILRYGLDRKFHLYKYKNGFVSHYASAVSAMNLIEGGGCEDLGKWKLDMVNPNTATLVLDSVNKKYGNKSVKVSKSGTGLFYLYQNNVPVRAGGNYIILTDYTCPSASIGVRAGTGGSNNGAFGTTSFPATTTFKTGFHKFKPNVNKVNITFYASSSDFNIDGVRLYEVDTETYNKITTTDVEKIGSTFPFNTDSTKAFVFIQQIGDNFNLFSEVIE